MPLARPRPAEQAQRNQSSSMSKLANEFTWSHSRHNAFRECMRRYYFSYYGSWHGWESDASARQQELYLHNKLINRWLWKGKVIHDEIKKLLLQTATGKQPQELDQYLEQITQRMRKDFKDSREGKNALRPSKIVGLTEHHYSEVVTDETWKTLNQEVLQCFQTFWHSELFADISTLSKEQILEVDTLTSFDLDGLKVWVALDCCCRKDGVVHIYDWKTGNSDYGATSEQLACYALYAHARWGIAPSHLRLIEFNLARNEIRGHDTAGLDFEEILEKFLKMFMKF